MSQNSEDEPTQTQENTIHKPSETIHQAKLRHKNELKDLGKQVKGKQKKEKEKELQDKQMLELDALMKSWNLFNDTEQGITLKPQSSAEIASSVSPSDASDKPSHDDPVEAKQDMDEDLKIIYKKQVLSKNAKKRIAKLEKEKRLGTMLSKANQKLSSQDDKEVSQLNLQLDDIVFEGIYNGYVGGAIFDIPADGHCLFRAIAHQLSLYLPSEDTTANIPDFKYLRLQCCEEILENLEDYLPYFLNEDGELYSAEDVKEYAHRLSISSTSSPLWGSHVEIAILSKLYKRVIGVVHHEFVLKVGEGLSDRVNPTIWIVYHEQTEHYNSVVPKDLLHML